MIIHAFSVGWIRFSSVGCCHQESSHPRSAHSAAFIVHISCCHFCFFDTLIRLFLLPENDLIPGVKCFFGFRQAAQVAVFSWKCAHEERHFPPRIVSRHKSKFPLL